MKWWPFIYGHYQLQGVDLKKKFETLNAENTFNVIDAILIDDALRGAELKDNGYDKMRTAIVKIYSPNTTFLTGTSDHHDVLDDDLDIEGFSGDLREAPLG